MLCCVRNAITKGILIMLKILLGWIVLAVIVAAFVIRVIRWADGKD